jgi:hypothetical protein
MKYEEARSRAEALIQDVSQRTRALLSEGTDGVFGAVRTAWDEKVPTAHDVRRHVDDVLARVYASNVVQTVQARANRETLGAYRDEVTRRAHAVLERVPDLDGVTKHVKTLNKKVNEFAKKVTNNVTA